MLPEPETPETPETPSPPVNLSSGVHIAAGVPKLTIVPKKKKTYARVNASGSKLARPSSPIYQMAAEFQNHLHMPDPLALYAVTGTIAANMLLGYPVWLMLVGPSSSGKTALIRSFEQMAGVISIGSLTGEAAFLSGTKKKEREEGATGGLLREVGDNGLFLFSEFGDVLDMPREPMKRVLTILRQIYDGSWSRRIGEGGGRTLEWKGKVGLVGGVTNAIDDHQADMAAMGERLLYFRLQTGGYGEALSALRTTDAAAKLAARQAAVGALFETVQQTLDASLLDPKQRRSLTLPEEDRIIALGTFTARARSSVPRDMYSKEVKALASIESTPRVSGAMGQLLIGMEACGLDEEDRWRVLTQLATDSIPLLRKRVLEAVLAGCQYVPAVRDRVQVSESTTRRVMEELEILGLLVKDGRSGAWAVVGWVRERLAEDI